MSRAPKTGRSIFLSYADKDRDVALKIADGLRSEGLRVWTDLEILPGDNWAAELGRALESAQAMVVLLSPEAISSRSVRNDISYALGAKHLSGRLIPVYIRPAKGAPWILDSIQNLNYAGPGKTAKKIVELLAQASDAPKINRTAT